MNTHILYVSHSIPDMIKTNFTDSARLNKGLFKIEYYKIVTTLIKYNEEWKSVEIWSRAQADLAAALYIAQKCIICNTLHNRILE